MIALILSNIYHLQKRIKPMFKTFKLKEKRAEQLSDTEGKITFLIEDENGFERTVWGTTQLDQDTNPISISAIRSREHPLIQCLFITNVNEEFNIEFTQYNDVFERTDDDQKIITADDLDKIMQEMQDKPMRVGALLKSVEVKTTESMS